MKVKISADLLEEAKQIHAESIIIDAHCDTALHIIDRLGRPGWKPRSIVERSEQGHVDIPRLFEAGVTCQFFAIYVDAIYKPEKATARALELISALYSEFEKAEGKVVVAKSTEDILKAKNQGKISALISLEGGEPIQFSPLLLKAFHMLGMRAMSLTWNERNMLADGISESITKGGLTTLGLKVIEKMEDLGIIVDVSHISEAGFWDIVENCSKPIIASHSDCRELCNHPRNLTDEQLKAIAEKNGVVGVNFYPKFLVKDGEATIDDVVRHIDHIVNVAGINHVGLGSDFDGISSTPKGLEDVSKLPNLTAKLIERGYSKSEIKKILGENFLRVIREVVG
ncbi:MAG: dipeptidase [archaeon GB-1867-005]|nr:dipeptidase [Candidatus Culexmicrobium cathedralense]